MAPGAFAIERQYTCSQPLPHPPPEVLPATRFAPKLTLPKAPEPIPWSPQFDPENWIYTDGSLIEGESRLGAAVIHIPTSTTLHIDASGHEETHTIMRAELVAIYVALDRLNALVDFNLFTNSLSSLQAIRKRLYHPDPEAYHHHQVLIDKIASLILEREHSGRTTTLSKVRAHTNVMGNELADEAAKLSVRQFDELPAAMKISVTLGAVAPRPPFWVMYTHSPATPPAEAAVGPHTMTLRTPWWTVPEEERLHMRAFTRPSKQLRNKVRPALLRSLLHTSLYRRLLLRAITNGARTAQVGKGIHSRINRKPGDGITLLKFLHGQYYTGKLAYRYGHAPSDACPLCGLPDSCTHVAGECPAHASRIISKHNAACLLTHATVRKAFKGGGALFSPHTFHLVTADAGNKSQTPGAVLDSLGTPSSPSLPLAPSESPDWLDPIDDPAPPQPPRRHPRHIDVSADVWNLLRQEEANARDEECTTAPSYIPEWVLPAAELQALIDAGKGAAPDLIYARGVPSFPAPHLSQFQRSECTLLLIEVGFCRDLGCTEKRAEKQTKYAPLIDALRLHWGAVEFVCIPIGHAGTTLQSTLHDLSSALARVRPHFADRRRRQGHKQPDVDAKALKHDKTLVKTLLDALCNLAQDRLLGILQNRSKEIQAFDPNRARPPYRPRGGISGSTAPLPE